MTNSSFVSSLVARENISEGSRIRTIFPSPKIVAPDNPGIIDKKSTKGFITISCCFNKSSTISPIFFDSEESITIGIKSLS